jgi:hypothetical protein
MHCDRAARRRARIIEVRRSMNFMRQIAQNGAITRRKRLGTLGA